MNFLKLSYFNLERIIYNFKLINTMFGIKLFGNKKLRGQGALEYLLIIGVAIIIVAIIVMMIANLTSQPSQSGSIITEQMTGLQVAQFERSTGLNVGEQLSINEPIVNQDLDYLFQLNSSSVYDTKNETNAAEYNSAIFSENGLWDTNAYFFDSSKPNETYIQIRQDLKQNVTYSLWIKPTKQKNTDSYFFSGMSALGSGGDNPNQAVHWRQRIMILNDNKIRFRQYIHNCKHAGTSGASVLIDSINSIRINEWSNIVWSIDFNSDDYWITRIYINGKLQGETIRESVNQELSQCTDQTRFVWLGRRKSEDDPNTNFDGYIEEFARWERVLSEEEIRNLYIKGSGSFPK